MISVINCYVICNEMYVSAFANSCDGSNISNCYVIGSLMTESALASNCFEIVVSNCYVVNPLNNNSQPYVYNSIDHSINACTYGASWTSANASLALNMEHWTDMGFNMPFLLSVFKTDLFPYKTRTDYLEPNLSFDISLQTFNGYMILDILDTDVVITDNNINFTFDTPRELTITATTFLDMFNNNVYGYLIDSFTYTTLEPIISNVCFIKGTKVLTDQGTKNIDEITIETINKKPVIITKTKTTDKYLVCIEKDALSKNVPSEKTIVSKNHLIKYKDQMIRANDLLNINEKIYTKKYKGEILYNVLFNNEHNIININNMECESLHPDHDIAKIFTCNNIDNKFIQFKISK